MTKIRHLSRDTFRSLRIRNYRLYFVGQVVSVSGTWMQSLAQSWLVLGLTHSGVALGITIALQFLPMLLLGGFGGVIVDRFDKRRLLVLTQIAAAALALALGTINAFGGARVWNVYLLALLLGVVNAIDTPARQTFVNEMVGEADLPNAVGLNSVMMNSARVVGPAIGGAVIAAVGVTACFFLNALSYVAVIGALAAMDGSRLHRVAPIERARGQLREGYRYVWQDDALRIPLIMMAVIGTLAFNFVVILPLLATRTFHTGAGGFGGLTSVMGAGAVAGGLAAATRRGLSTPRLFKLGLVFGVTLTATALAPTLAVEVVTLLFMGAAAFAFISTANTTMQLSSSNEMRGRVMALYSIAVLGSTPVGGPLVGWISQHYGPRAALLLGGTATLLATAVAWHALNVRTHGRANGASAGGEDLAVRAA